MIVVLSVATIDAGYFFEGVGIPLGKFEFGSKSLTRPVTPGMKRPHSKNELLEATWQFRVNRLRGTWLENIPCPLPEHYVLGFDEQKIETEGIPLRFFKAINSPDGAERARMVAQEQDVPESSTDEKGAYPVYLNGELKRTGWWYYYLLTLIYKVPEGTWLLVILSLASLRFVGRSSAEWAEEITLWTVPVVIFFSMSFLDRHQSWIAVCSGDPALSIHFHGQTCPLGAWAFGSPEVGDDGARRRCAGLDDRRLGLDLSRTTSLTSTGPQVGPTRNQPG